MALKDKREQNQLKLINEIINNSNSYVYVVDAETYELLYVNTKMESLSGKSVAEACGNTCYNYIKGLKQPCENCFIKYANKTTLTEKFYKSPITERIYTTRCKIIDWFGKDAFIVYLTDDTDKKKEQKMIKDLLNNIPGGIGIYNYYKDGTLEQVYLNDGYYKMIGATRERRKEYYGFSVTNAIHPDDKKVMFKKVNDCLKNGELIDVDVRVLCGENNYKWFKIRAAISSKDEEKVVLYTFYDDINELKNAHDKLETGQKAINLASERQGLSFSVYYIDEKRLEFAFNNKSPLGYNKVIENFPDVAFNTRSIYSEDMDKFKQLYVDLHNGVPQTECLVRVLNRSTRIYEWQHMVYINANDELYGKRVAIGFSANANIEQENNQKYNNEVKLRKQIIKNAIFYYRLNLTTGIFEEYQNNAENGVFVKSGMRVSEDNRMEIIKNVFVEDREKVINNIFSEAILKMHNEGKTSNSIVYRRYLKPNVLVWVETFVNVIESPEHELIAFIYSYNIDKKRKRQLAVDEAISKEFESIVIANVQTGQAQISNLKVECANFYDGKVFDYNQGMKEAIDFEVNEEDRGICYNFFTIENLIEKLKDNNSYILTYRVNGENGEILRKKVRAFYLDEQHEDVIIVRKDITDLYEDEQKQKQKLKKAMDNAIDANNAKSEFLSRMSHDIRTPLTSIIALSENELTQNISEEKKNDYLNKINISGKFLLSLVNDVLDMSKIENRKLVLNNEVYSFFEFEEVINTVIVDKCKEKNIEFIFKTFESHKKNIIVDKVRFNQIIINLLSNAVKFTPEGGKIEFTIEKLGYRDDKILERYTIKDNGVGMSKEFIPHCFEIFAQEQQAQHVSNMQGTGLGLSIVKQLVNAMGGTISVESELNKGTKFVVDLALIETDEESIAEENDKINDYAILKDLNILMCEDNKINSEIIKYILTEKGCKVTLRTNGQEGLDAFKNSNLWTYDIILMDIRMPVMNGIDATKQIRSLDREDAKKIPIVALTADAFNVDYVISKDAGMTAHLTKPIDTKLMYKTIIKYVVRSREKK